MKKKYSSTLSLTSALYVGGCSTPRPRCFASQEERQTWYPLYMRLGGPQDRAKWVWKISRALGFDPRTVQPVTSRYTDYATRSTCFLYCTQTQRHIKNTTIRTYMNMLTTGSFRHLAQHLGRQLGRTRCLYLHVSHTALGYPKAHSYLTAVLNCPIPHIALDR